MATMPRVVGSAVAALLGLAYVLALASALSNPDSEAWVALVSIPVLMLLSLPVFVWASRRFSAGWLLPLATGALTAKLVSALVRYWTVMAFYGGVGDAVSYDRAGTHIAQQMQTGLLPETNNLVGTRFIELVTGIVYSLGVPSIFLGYLVFSWIGFWGLFMAVLAYMTAFPDGFPARYATLTFFLPSMLFWPSGLGKEAWMMLGIGAVMLGAAILFDGRVRGVVPLLAGLAATGMVRPHVSVILVGGVAAAMFVRPARRRTELTPIIKLGTLVAVAALLVVAVRAAADFLGIEAVDPASLQNEWQWANGQTAQGGSSFEGAYTTSVTGVPWALVTVLFRPFPYEAGGVLPLLTSLEGVLLIGLLIRYGRPLLKLPRFLRGHPYVTFCLTYVIFYSVLFSGFANFGILARQRSLVLPAFLVLLALPSVVRGTRSTTVTTSSPSSDQHFTADSSSTRVDTRSWLRGQ